MVTALGTGKHVVVKISGEKKLHGHIRAIETEHFTLLPDNQSEPIQIAYAEVWQVGKNLGTGGHLSHHRRSCGSGCGGRRGRLRWGGTSPNPTRPDPNGNPTASRRLAVRFDIRDHVIKIPRFGLPETPTISDGIFFPVKGSVHQIEVLAGVVFYLR